MMSVLKSNVNENSNLLSETFDTFGSFVISNHSLSFFGTIPRPRKLSSDSVICFYRAKPKFFSAIS